MRRHRFASSSGKFPTLAFIDTTVQGASSCGDNVSSLMYSGAWSRSVSPPGYGGWLEHSFFVSESHIISVGLLRGTVVTHLDADRLW